jgi:hypothetical protein
MNEHDDLISRLRAFGRRPVDPDLATRHLAAMVAPSLAGAPRRSHRLRVVAAFAVGLLAGTTGLATAGALPNGAQEVAHHTLGSVGVNVPHGDRYQGPECGGAVRNHGQYVRSQPKGNRAAAGASRCGKPLNAGDGDEPGDGNGAPAKAGCQGPPPWAGKGKPDQAAKDARKQACGDHDGDDEAGDDQKGGENQTAPTPAPEAVQGAGATPETPPPSAATTPPATEEPPTTTTTAPVTTSSTTPTDDPTSSTAVPVPVPGSGS